MERSEARVTEAKTQAEAIFRVKEQEWIAGTAHVRDEAERVSTSWRSKHESADTRWSIKLQKSEAHVAQLQSKAIADASSDSRDIVEKLEKKRSS